MQSRGAGGIQLALLSAATFGSAGAFGSALLQTGWSSGAVVTARVILAALVLTVPAIVALRGQWGLLQRNWQLIVLYGSISVAATQVFYFNAVGRLTVGTALLLEYLGPIVVVGWLWLRWGKRPHRLTIAGMVLALAGLVLVLNLTGETRVDPIGVLWGLAAAGGLASYFLLSAKLDTGLSPIALAWAGMVVGAVSLAIVGAIGVMPIRTAADPVSLAGVSMPWWAAVLWLGVIAAGIAYATGVAATRRLGSTVASFVGLTEVMFAVIFAWLLLGELPLVVQLLGGVLIIAGVAVIKIDESRQSPKVMQAQRQPLA